MKTMLQKTKIRILIACLFMGVSGIAQTTKLVTNTNDSGTGSLRDAINIADDGDTVRLSPSLLSAGSATIVLSSEISISGKSLVIKGVYNNLDTVYISGNNANRIFNISYLGYDDFILDSLCLINGFSNQNGGTVQFDAGSNSWLTISNCIIKNSAANYGGVMSLSTTVPIYVKLNNCTFSDNTANINGGVFYANASSVSLIIDKCTFVNNSATQGGGVYTLVEGSSTVDIESSTFVNNTADNGGGVYSYSTGDGNPTSLVTIGNSTFANNSATTSGGGVSSVANYIDLGFGGSGLSSVTIENSTIVNNTSPSGAGVYSFTNLGSSNMLVKGSVVFNGVNNINSNVNGSQSALTSGGFNIFSDAPNGFDVASDSVNVSLASLNLLPLAFNGGAAQTMLPGVGSIAIDAGDVSDVSSAQNRPIVGVRDRGAAEYNCKVNEVATKSACDSYSWIDGNTYSSDNNTAEHTVWSTTSGVCDTAYTLNLTISDLPDNTTTVSGVTISAVQTGATYKWIDCDDNNSVISGETSQSFTATLNGNYSVIIENGTCVDTSACVAISTVGIETITKDKLMLYPNPTNDQFTIEYDGVIKDVELVDMTGRVISISYSATQNTVLLDNVEPGKYMVKVLTENDDVVMKQLVVFK